MKIFTFLGPVSGKSRRAELALAELWTNSWRANGWDPVILTPDSISRDAESCRLLNKFSRLPSRNKQNLDTWCYARWLAVAQHGGGFMCDYDVINYGFPPTASGPLTIHSGIVPCLVSGETSEFLRAVAWFDALPMPKWRLWGRGSHISDMLIVSQRRGECMQNLDCVEFGAPGWEDARAVHFSNFSMTPGGYQPRHEWIPRLRPLSV